MCNNYGKTPTTTLGLSLLVCSSLDVGEEVQYLERSICLLVNDFSSYFVFTSHHCYSSVSLNESGANELWRDEGETLGLC